MFEPRSNEAFIAATSCLLMHHVLSRVESNSDARRAHCPSVRRTPCTSLCVIFQQRRRSLLQTATTTISSSVTRRLGITTPCMRRICRFSVTTFLHTVTRLKMSIVGGSAMCESARSFTQTHTHTHTCTRTRTHAHTRL